MVIKYCFVLFLLLSLNFFPQKKGCSNSESNMTQNKSKDTTVGIGSLEIGADLLGNAELLGITCVYYSEKNHRYFEYLTFDPFKTNFDEFFCEQQPELRLRIENSVPPLTIHASCDFIEFVELANINDLNQDTRSEIGIVLYGLNGKPSYTCMIYTYLESGWKLLSTFTMHKKKYMEGTRLENFIFIENNTYYYWNYIESPFGGRTKEILFNVE